MELRAHKSQVIIIAHVAVLSAVVGAFHGVMVATLFVLAGFLGYLNAFAGFRGLLAIVRRRQVSRATALLAVLSAFGSAALAWFGYWPLLTLCTLSFVFIDAVVLQFVGPPVGTASGAA